jgi:TRAP-type C4-dicarboxylate transport system substrate-binding protein
MPNMQKTSMQPARMRCVSQCSAIDEFPFCRGGLRECGAYIRIAVLRNQYYEKKFIISGNFFPGCAFKNADFDFAYAHDMRRKRGVSPFARCFSRWAEDRNETCLFKSSNEAQIGNEIRWRYAHFRFDAIALKMKGRKCMKKVKATAIFLVMVMVSLSLAACGGGGGNDDGGTSGTVTLRLASDAPQDHIATKLNEEACALIEEQTEGRVKVTYHGASQLGSYESVYEELMMGSIDLAQITVPDATDVRLGMAYLPYYATSYEEAKVLYAPDSYMSRKFAELNAENGVRFVGWVLEGFIGMGTVKEPTDVMTPGTNKHTKLRSPAMATFLYVQEDLGYQPITITYAEVPTAIQTNVVEGWIGGTPNMNYAWVGDVINHMYVNFIHAEATCYVASEKGLAKLSEEDRQTVLDILTGQSDKSFSEAQANEEVYKEKLTEKGVEVIELTAAELKANADYVRETTWTRLEDELTKELIDGFRAEIKQFQ